MTLAALAFLLLLRLVLTQETSPPLLSNKCRFLKSEMRMKSPVEMGSRSTFWYAKVWSLKFYQSQFKLAWLQSFAERPFWHNFAPRSIRIQFWHFIWNHWTDNDHALGTIVRTEHVTSFQNERLTLWGMVADSSRISLVRG